MISRKFIIKNEQGLHARPANIFVNECAGFDCGIELVKDGKSCNAKSIIQVLTLCVHQGAEIEVICSGNDENEAMAGLAGLIENGFGK